MADDAKQDNLFATFWGAKERRNLLARGKQSFWFIPNNGTLTSEVAPQTA